MPLEDLTGNKYINSLNTSNPVGATDDILQGDDHIRGIKNVLTKSFPNISGAMTATHTELNNLAGVSANVASILSAADYAAIRSLLSLVPGTNVQAYSAELATIAGFGASNLARLTTVQQFADAKYCGVTALTSASNLTPIDLDDSNNFSMALSENTTLQNPSTVNVGQAGVIYITNTTFTLAYGTQWYFEGGHPTLPTDAGGVKCLLGYYAAASGVVVANLIGPLTNS